MAFEEFKGELDTPAGGGSFTPFSGELDAPAKSVTAPVPAAKTRTEPVYDPVSGAQIGTNEVPDEPVAKGGAVADELANLRDSFFTGVDNTRASVKTVNMGMEASRLQSTKKRLQELEARGQGESRNARLMRDEISSAQQKLPTAIGEMTEAQGDAQRGAAMTTRPAVAKVNAAKTFGEAWEAFKEAPYDVIAGVTATSLPSTLPALAAAAVMGPGAGAAAMGASSAAVEGGSSLADFARDAGVDVTNAKAVEAFFTNPENLSAAMTYAGKRAGIIGGLDAVSGGMAGKTIAPAMKSKLARQAVNLPTQMAVQAGLGAGGEALGQLATKGEIDAPGQVLMEAAGELGGAPMEVAAFSKEARDAMRPAAPAKVDPIAEIAKAPTVDKAIAAAQAAVQSSSAVDNIQNILATQNLTASPSQQAQTAIADIEAGQETANAPAVTPTPQTTAQAAMPAAIDEIPAGAAAGDASQPAGPGALLDSVRAEPVDRALDPRLVPASKRVAAQQPQSSSPARAVDTAQAAINTVANTPQNNVQQATPNVQDQTPAGPAAEGQATPAQTPEARASAGVQPTAAGTPAGNPAVQTTGVDQRLVPLSKRVKLDADPAAAAKAEAVTGEQLDKQWTAFAPDSGTLAVSRADMPQIKAEHRGAMVNFLNARGIAHQQEEVAASSLKTTQAEFSPGKVAQAKGFTGNDRSILVSADGHVLDGHHQWMSKLEAGEPVKVIRLDAPIKQLLETVKEFPSAEVSAGATAATPDAPKLSARQVALAAERDRIEAKRAERKAARAEIAKAPEGLSVGMMPNSAEPVTVKDGVVYVGKYPAQNYETGDDVTVPAGASDDQIRKALLDSGALGKKARIFGASNQAPAHTIPAQDATVSIAPDAAAQRAEFAASEKARKVPGNAARTRANEANPFKAFLGKHGISNALANEFAPGRKERQAAMVQGYGPVFRKSGLQLDELAQRAVEEGFLLEADEAKLQNLILDALRGKRIIAQYAEGVAEDEMQARMDAAEEFARQLPDDVLEDLDAGIPFNDTTSNTSTEDAMRALGFTDQEIQDATASQSQSPGQGSESRGRTDETAKNAAQGRGEEGNAAPRDDAEGLKPTNSLARTASWVIREKSTGNVILETFDRKKVDALNTEKYEAVPIGEYLGGLNRATEPAGLTAPTKEDVLAQQQRAGDGAKADAKAATAADNKAKADAEVNEFTLTGSERAADADPNQQPMFSRAPAEQATDILDAAGVTGKDRLDVLKDVKAGTLTPEEVQAAYPAKDQDGQIAMSRAATPGPVPPLEAFKTKSGATAFKTPEIALANPQLNVRQPGGGVKRIDYEIRDRVLYAEARADGASVSDAQEESHVGTITLDVDASGVFKSLRNIEIFQSKRGNAMAEKVVGGIVESLPAGAKLHIHDILPTATGFWDKMGASFPRSEDFMEANLSPQQFRNAYDTRKSTQGTRGQPQESRATTDTGTDGGRRGNDGNAVSAGPQAAVRNPSTVDRVQAAVAELIGGKQLPNKLGRVVATTASEIKAYWEPQIGLNVQLSADEKAGAAQAFYDPRTKTVFLIADHIPTGDEQAVAAHELMHKHGQTVLGAEGWEKLHDTINGWANAEEDSDERAVYTYARRQVEAVGTELSSQEMFPYAVEAAIKMGVKPSLIAKKGTVARWLGSVKFAMQQAWGKVTGKPETFKTQDLVDLAFGIAQMENPESAAAIGRLESERTDPLSTPAFKAWFEGSKVVDAKGKPLRVFHGTTADFTEFQKERANPESDMGAGFYFTNMSSDVEANYAGEGPDLTNKIERRAEQIERELEDSAEPVDMDKARALARKEFSEHAGATMPVYLAIKNPVVIGGKNETVFGFEQPYDEETDDYGEETGTLVDVLMALQRMGYDDMNYGQIAEDLSDAMGDGGIKASELIDKLKASEGLQYATDENGNLYSTEIIRQAFEEAGFDGIIDNTVNAKFGSERSTGKKMVGMKKGVVHYIAFEPTQVKSAIGNRGTFDPSNADIRFSRAKPDDAQQGIADAKQPTAKAELSPWRDATGRLQFAPGAWLYDKIGTASGPTLTRLGLKAASPELRRQLRQMKIDVEKAQETAGAIAKETTKLSEAERAMVSDLVEQELQVGVIPPAHAVKLAAMINDAMGRQTDELVALDMLTKDSADKWRGKYLPRYYESKLSAKVGDAWADAMKRLTGRQSVMKGIKGKNLKGRGLYETIPEDQLKDYEALGWEVRDPDYTPNLPSVDGSVQVWRDFTPEEREKMGEIRDAGFRFVMGYMQTGRDIAVGRMFARMAADPEQSSRLEKEGYVQVPTTTVSGTGAKVYGKLAGRWVPAETLSQLSNIEESTSAAWQMYRKAMGIWKEGKTALNPVSHVNNMVSNLTMAHLAGVSYHRGDKYLAAARDFVKKGPMMAEAKENGLFLGTLSDTELMNTLPEELKILAQKQESKGEKVARTGFDIMTMFLRKPMGAAYQGEDTFFRYLIYKDARERGLEPQEAVDYAQKYIFTYDDLPKGARRIRDFGIPFFSYTYKAAPALLHTALTHPVRMAAPAAVLWGINAAAYAIATGDDEDSWQETLKKYLTDPEFRAKAREKEKLEREHLPPWNKGTTALMTPKTIRLGMDEVTKLPLFIDISRIIPGGDLFDASPNAGGLPIPQPITPSHPIFTTMVAMLGNKDMFLGKEITDSNDTMGEKAAKRSAWLWTQLTPAITAGNYHWNRGMNALAQANGGEVKWVPDVLGGDATGIGKDGNPVQPKYAAMQTFGIKVRPMDLETAEAIEGSMKRKMIRDIDGEIKKLQRYASKGAISERTLEKERDKAIQKKENLRNGLTVDGNEKD